jgi:NADPH:quinone reductase-like Zn-dependent oxidoreductase
MARHVQYREYGGPEVLEIVETETPRPGPGEVVVEVKAAGVNPVDWKLRRGARGGPIDEPRRAGVDAAGVIIEVGDLVTGWSVGDEVITRGVMGTYATHVVAPPANLVAKPAALSWAQAAAIGVPVGTAYQALVSLGVGSGMTVLVHGGSGGVGQAALQFAREWGATVVATASVRNHGRLRELGAIPVEYGPGLADRLRAAVPNGIDRVLDAAGTDEAIDVSLELVADPSHIGTVVVYPRAAELGIRGWGAGMLTTEEAELRAEAFSAVAGLVEAGRFELEISREYPLDEVAEAHRESEAGHVRGKIVLVP